MKYGNISRMTLLFVLIITGFVIQCFAEISSETVQASHRWHNWRRAQQQFPLASWAYFPKYPGTVEEFEMYAGCNLNMVNVTQEQYENATKAGLNVLVGGWLYLHKNPEKLKELISFPHPGQSKVIGYQLMDEPKPDSFEGLKEALQTIYTKDHRNTLPIIDLLPNWAWQRNTHRVTRFGYHYDAYMRDYISEVQPPVLLNCHYPPLDDGSDRVEYYPNLETFRKHALQNDIGLMGFILNNAHFGYRAVSESDIYWQVYSYLAYGAQGIWYYNWRISPTGNFGEGLVTHETGEPTDQYYMAKKVNAEILAIDHILMKLKSVNVFHTGQTIPQGTTLFPNDGDSGSSVIERFETDNFIIGEFINQDDPQDKDHYVLLVNKRHGKGLACDDASLCVTAIFNPSDAYPFVYVYDTSTGQLNPVESASYQNKAGYYQLKFKGGQGRLLRFSAKPLEANAGGLKDMPVRTAMFVRKPLEIDGKLDDPIWKRSQSHELMRSKNSASAEPNEKGSFKVAFRDQYITVAASFEDTDILAQGEKDDLPHYRLGDVCEIFLKPLYSDWYWEIWLTPHGKKNSLFWEKEKIQGREIGKNYKLNMDYASVMDGTLNQTKDKDKGWTCEVYISFEELTQDGSLDVRGPWTILVARQNYTGQVNTNTRELSMDPQLSRDFFHILDEYARLELRVR